MGLTVLAVLGNAVVSDPPLRVPESVQRSAMENAVGSKDAEKSEQAVPSPSRLQKCTHRGLTQIKFNPSYIRPYEEQRMAYMKKRQLVQQYLVLLLHAEKCPRQETHIPELWKCSIYSCQIMKNLRNHMITCRTINNCPVPRCSLSRQISNHWRYCSSTDCSICMPFKLADPERGINSNIGMTVWASLSSDDMNVIDALPIQCSASDRGSGLDTAPVQTPSVTVNDDSCETNQAQFNPFNVILKCTKKRQRIQQFLVILLHVENCQSLGLNGEDLECVINSCAAFKNVINHIITCENGENCECWPMKRIMDHWKHCKRSNCSICMPFKQPHRNDGIKFNPNAVISIRARILPDDLLVIHSLLHHGGAEVDQTQTYIPHSDPKKLKFTQQHLALLLHGHKCLLRNANGDTRQCTFSDCTIMKDYFNHLIICQAGKNCTVPRCLSSKHLLNHWKQCNQDDCAVCLPSRSTSKNYFNIITITTDTPTVSNTTSAGGSGSGLSTDPTQIPTTVRPGSSRPVRAAGVQDVTNVSDTLQQIKMLLPPEFDSHCPYQTNQSNVPGDQPNLPNVANQELSQQQNLPPNNIATTSANTGESHQSTQFDFRNPLIEKLSQPMFSFPKTDPMMTIRSHKLVAFALRVEDTYKITPLRPKEQQVPNIALGDNATPPMDTVQATIDTSTTTNPLTFYMKRSYDVMDIQCANCGLSTGPKQIPTVAVEEPRAKRKPYSPYNGPPNSVPPYKNGYDS